MPSTIRLVQSFAETRIEVEPLFGEFPDNALLVLELAGPLEEADLALRDQGLGARPHVARQQRPEEGEDPSTSTRRDAES